MFEHGLGEHCFRGGWISHFFQSSKSGSVVARDFSAKSHWFVSSCIHSLEPTKTGQATPSVSVARLVPWVFLHSSKCGEVRIQISSGVWSSQFQSCHRLGDRFLSRPPARRSGSSRSLERGNASRPPARRSTRWQRWRLIRRGDALAGADSPRGAIHGVARVD